MKIKIKKGYDIPLAGKVVDQVPVSIPAGRVGIYTEDYPGIVPKPAVHEGDFVETLAPVIFHKDDSRIKICSPVSGRVVKVCRGERRKLIYIEIEKSEISGTADCELHKTSDKDSIRRMPVIDMLCATGIMAMIRQRPYDIVPNPAEEPRDIFITAIDSAPLADGLCAPAVVWKEAVVAGLKALTEATKGKVYISMLENQRLQDQSLKSIIEESRIDRVEVVEFVGKHPVGNAGIQASHIAPVNKGDIIWTLDIRALNRIGECRLQGSYTTSTIVAVCGPEVESPRLVLTDIGAQIKPIVEKFIKSDDNNKRFISGNVLTGVKESMEGFLHFPWRQVTVIREGNDVDEFLGWASLSPSKLSAGRTFPFSWLKKEYSPDARLLGGRRAMILSGQYDKVIPMDILPEYLLKAIIGKDIESMEKLGIYEVAPEDFALAEFVDASKIPLQKIVREGLDYLRKENA